MSRTVVLCVHSSHRALLRSGSKIRSCLRGLCGASRSGIAILGLGVASGIALIASGVAKINRINSTFDAGSASDSAAIGLTRDECVAAIKKVLLVYLSIDFGLPGLWACALIRWGTLMQAKNTATTDMWAVQPRHEVPTATATDDLQAVEWHHDVPVATPVEPVGGQKTPMHGIRVLMPANAVRVVQSTGPQM